MKEQMELFSEGGLRDEGGEIEPKSGNKVPSGSLKKEVADDIPVMISEGEFVFPADVVRYIGLETLIKMRQDAKQGLKMMEKMGQMGNPEEAELPDDIPFGMADLIVVSGKMKEDDDKEEKAEGGVVGLQQGGINLSKRIPSTHPFFKSDAYKRYQNDTDTAYAQVMTAASDGNVFGNPGLAAAYDEYLKTKPAEETPTDTGGGGGLLNDPRFKRPSTGDTPTIGDENKKEIEDALLGTVYGTITMRRYVNADGVVKYIPFIGEEPQMEIPEGFELDNSAPTPTNTTVTSISQDSDGGSTATSYNQLNPNLNPFKDQASVNFDINNLDANQLVDYYGSFSSPMNRFLSVGVGALFGGLPALGIATMQQFAQTRGPNSLKATEDKLAQMVKNGEISGDLLDKLKAFQKRAKEKGTGPRSFLSRLIGGASGGDKKKADTLTKAVQAGDVTTVEKVSQEAVEQNVQKALNDAIANIRADIDLENEPEAKSNPTLINTVGGLVDIARTSTFDSMVNRELEESADRTAAMSDFTQQVPEAFAKPFEREKADRLAAMSDFTRQIPSAVTPIRTDDITTEDALAKATGTDVFKTAFGLEDFGKVKASPYEAEGRSQLGSGFKSAEQDRLDLMRRGRGRTKEQEQEEQKQQTKKRTRKADQPRAGILPRRGERFPDVGLDRPSRFGQTRVDDFLLGVQRDDKGNITNLTEQQQKNIRQNVQDLENIQQKLDQEDRVRQSRGFGPMSVQERFDRQQQEFTGFDSQGNFLGGMYVGGVPTKPMKPQRLKQGGLAKPKVKPKRMKKGGLASKKK